MPACGSRRIARALVGDVRPPLLMLMGAVGLRAADRLRQRRQPAAGARPARARASWRSARLPRRQPRGASSASCSSRACCSPSADRSSGSPSRRGHARARRGWPPSGCRTSTACPSMPPGAALHGGPWTVLTVVLFGLGPAVRGGAPSTCTRSCGDGWRATRSAARPPARGRVRVGLSSPCRWCCWSVAALLLRSLGRAAVRGSRLPAGGRARGPRVDAVAGCAGGAQQARAQAFYSQLDARVAALPGVRRAGLSSTAPFSDGETAQISPSRAASRGRTSRSWWRGPRGDPAYFEAAGTRLRRGRLSRRATGPDMPARRRRDETLTGRPRRWQRPRADAPPRATRAVGTIWASSKRQALQPRRRGADAPSTSPRAASAPGDGFRRADDGEPASLASAVRQNPRARSEPAVLRRAHARRRDQRSVGTRRLTNRLLGVVLDRGVWCWPRSGF